LQVVLSGTVNTNNLSTLCERIGIVGLISSKKLSSEYEVVKKIKISESHASHTHFVFFLISAIRYKTKTLFNDFLGLKCY